MSKRTSDEYLKGTQEKNSEGKPAQEAPAPKKAKLAFSIGKKVLYQNNLKNVIKKTEEKPKPIKNSLREAFNSDSEEEEEMPREAKMRMRNIGRDTPTSAGPNSFGKTKQGFCDAKKVFEKKLRAAAESTAD
ncbi:PEST proteolytic signal-containing nuclear protein-like [Cimex lectularius]|uniref:PEST proteolytic signal-containing nuclear protein n=1 Tax=Cimex lectularius TaxID=79782 RepID=A0A8I6R6P3_CIMLE|nr:PEST proteolytic signal-containing nuclear protein-like [Cimex lectularius]